MGLIPKQQQSPRARALGIALSSGLPFVCYLCTASSHGYWLDAGEFVAASVELGISHPPGQPLASLVGRLFCMLPLGPASLRVAFASATMAACAAALLFCAIRTVLCSMRVSEPMAVVLSVGSTWFVAGSYGWWFQAVRPEVYALQAALTCLMLERTMALEAQWPTLDVRALLTAALAMGLALANHHFLAVLMLPALMPTAARVMRARGLRPVALAAALGLLGLVAYAYLPLRGAAEPLPNLGAPTTASRMLWVVSAQAFQKNTGSGVPQPLTERYADVAAQLVENLHIFCPLALLGLYAMFRTPGVRRLAWVCLLALVVPIAARAWLGFVRSNPDALGYLLPAFAAIAVASAAFVGALVRAATGVGTKASGPWARRLSMGVAAVVLVLGLAQTHNSAAKASLKGFTATDDLDDSLRRTLPPRAVVLAHAPQTVFLYWGGQGEDGLRPDVTLVPIPFVTYPGMADALVKRHPELRQVLSAHLLNGQLPHAELQTLAAQRPVLIEMDVRVPPSLYATMVPSGLYFQVLAGGATDTDERIAARQQRAHYRRLYERLDKRLATHRLRTQRMEPLTRDRLLWHHFNDALYYMGFGDRSSARIALRMAKRLQPLAQPLDAMQAAVNDTEQKGPIDVTPFIQAIRQ